MQAKVYAPTIEQRREGLKVAERFWTPGLIVRPGIYAALVLAHGWYDSDFALPFTLDWTDLAVGLFGAVIGEIVLFFSKKDRAKMQFEECAAIANAHGPVQYRLTEAGVESWMAGDHHHDAWSRFSRFKLTDELLILVYRDGKNDYWAFPRQSIGEPLLSVMLRKLEESGATSAADS